MKYSKDLIEKAVKSKGYSWFENGDFNLNIVGIRNSQPGNLVTNLFDDILTVSYKENGVWKYHEFACTTVYDWITPRKIFCFKAKERM